MILFCYKNEITVAGMNAEDIVSIILHPPLTMKDLKWGIWIAKRTGDLKDLPKLKEFANTVGQTIHSEDEAESEDGFESEPESELEQGSKPESETD